jgi:hypothetical protein
MGSNIAARRAAKALRRKTIVAQKRKAEQLATSLPELVRRAAATPIQHCVLHAGLFESGMGTLVVARGGSKTGQLVFASFLIDSWCLGIKDTFVRTLWADEFAAYLDRVEMLESLEPVGPAHARKLLRDLTSWSRSIGFVPHGDFTAIEPIFGDVNADACETVFQFGRNGKPVYIPGPSETPAQVNLHLQRLRNRFGDDGFEMIDVAA